MKATLVMTPLFLLMAIVTGCEKFDEGGSLAKAEKRITETLWVIQSATDIEEGVDITADYLGEAWEFTSDKEFKINAELEGTYTFSEDMLNLIISETEGDMESFRIERLDKEAMWLMIPGEEELRFAPY